MKSKTPDSIEKRAREFLLRNGSRYCGGNSVEMLADFARQELSREGAKRRHYSQEGVKAWMIKYGTASLVRSCEFVYPSETLAAKEAERMAGYYPTHLSIKLTVVPVEIRELPLSNRRVKARKSK